MPRLAAALAADYGGHQYGLPVAVLARAQDHATATFERAVAAINDIGLLAEEVEGPNGEVIGNFPQTFSHIGLINAAWAISQAQQRAASRGQDR